MGKFDGWVFCTDLDGTLLKNDGSLSQENRDAIEYFKNEGGFFTFVTGRMPFFIADIYDAVRPNAPIGCINGGGLYDYPRQTYLWQKEMPREVIELIRCVDENCPGAGIQVNTFYHTYFSKENPTMEVFRRRTGLENLTCPYDQIQEPIAKILFGLETEEEMQQIQSLLSSHPNISRFDLIRSEKTLFEILPKGTGKGTALMKLTEHLKTDIQKTIAIGDYNNDISMMRAAGLGLAVSNACPDALLAADAITCSNEEHAISQVIRDLEEGRYVSIMKGSKPQ